VLTRARSAPEFPEASRARGGGLAGIVAMLKTPATAALSREARRSYDTQRGRKKGEARLMAYSERARAMRACRHVYPDGRRCKAWALWDDPPRLCMAHAGRHHRGPLPTDRVRRDLATKAVPCTCAAYAWPHRPGGGLCRWPEPPLYRCTTPPSTHKPGRWRPPRHMTRRGIHTIQQAQRLGLWRPW